MKLSAIVCLVWCSNIHTSSSTPLLPLLRGGGNNGSKEAAVIKEDEAKSAGTNYDTNKIINSQQLQIQTAATWHVKLDPGTDPSYSNTFGSVEPLFTLPQETLNKLSQAAPDLSDLTLWYRVTPPDKPNNGVGLFSISTGTALSIDNERVANIEIPMDSPPPGRRINRQLQSGTTNLQGNQGYLCPNMPGNNDIDAKYSWQFAGGSGEGVTINDVEYSWNINHEDLDPTIPTIVNAGDSINDPWSDTGHRMGVLGEMIGAYNGIGVQGISDMAKAKVVPESTWMGHNRANAIIRAVNDGKPGDVILLEMQVLACGVNYGPTEDDLSVFEATKVAVENGMVVVAAAGNGNEKP